MTTETLFRPLYRDAAKQGIDLAWLDEQPPYVVLWALYDMEEGQVSDADADHVRERYAARGITV